VEGLTRLGRPTEGWVSLAGDASLRRFHRLRPVAGGVPEILMVAGEPFVEAEDPFCLTARFLMQNRLPVPAVRGVDGAAGLVLLEDLGDATLESCFPEDRRAAGDAAAGGLEQLYGQAVDLAADLQALDPRRLPQWLPARRLFFDEEKLLWELHFFHRHFFGGLLGLTLPAGEEERLGDFYQQLCRLVAGFRPLVFCHRDYHSRNLMITGGQIVMVDFQDARLGPETYDLVSLLRDCYVDLGQELEGRLTGRYLERRPPAAGGEEFRRRFELTALQRGIKAAGTFAFQAVQRGNRRYLESLPLTLRRLQRAFASLPEYREAGRIICSRLAAV
jgi:aminoglycoside/choline kinase family phosphotransferase